MTRFSRSRLAAIGLAILAATAGVAPPSGGSMPVPVGTGDPGSETTARTAEGSAGAGPIAVLPIDNLSGGSAPLTDIVDGLRAALEARGQDLADPAVLGEFMARRRLRHTGGISTEIAGAFAAELGVRAVLVTSLTLYEEADPPKVALASRLISAGTEPSILWMDSAQISGNESPGILFLGMVSDPREVTRRVIGRLADSLCDALEAGTADARTARTSRTRPAARRLKPRKSSPVPEIAPAESGPLRVAVLPFANFSERRDAGDVLTVLFIQELFRRPEIEVIEPGLLRQAMLQSRLIMEGGLSIPQGDLLRAITGADLVLSGRVTQFRDLGGPWTLPEVDFAARALDTRSRKQVWTCLSFNQGDDGVFFFDVGRIYTSHRLASGMVRAAVQDLLGKRRKG